MTNHQPPSTEIVNKDAGVNSWLLVAFGVIFGLLAAGVILLVTTQPRGQAINLSPPPTAHSLVVYVSGAVVRPGMVTLPAGSRVDAAIQAAGGLAPGADDQLINPAALVLDGQNIVVPVKTTPLPQITPTAVPTLTPTRKSYLIDINTANQAELESLPAIGPVYASRILAYREKYGPFQSVEDLLKVYGITREILGIIQDFITINPPP
jgi:competence protein ComEA